MIISKTPYRISFLGGSTDYPTYYSEHPGAVLATTINKYCWISLRYLPPFFEHKNRIIYSQMEHTQNIDEIRHPSVRETLRFMNITEGVEVHHDSDVPARSGVGTSSSFTVGLLHALYALKGIMPTKMQLAREAIHIEQDIIKESVGSQDQTMAAFGGLNRIDFKGDAIEVTPIIMERERIKQLESSLMLFFTGFSRKASDIAAEQIKQTPYKKNELEEMYGMVQKGVNILNSNTSLEEFGKLLHHSWLLKRSLTDRISTPEIDNLYELALKAGATGGKLLGAGGGGFLLFFVKPSFQHRVREKLHDLLYVPFHFEQGGSQIIFYQP